MVSGFVDDGKRGRGILGARWVPVRGGRAIGPSAGAKRLRVRQDLRHVIEAGKQQIGGAARSGPRRLLASQALLCCTVAWALLGVGGVPRTSLFVLGVLGFGLGLLGLVAWRERRLPLGALVLGGLGLYSALQALPLPLAWCSFLVPRTHGLYETAGVPLGPPPAWASLSLDPGASLRAALAWATYAAVFVVATRVTEKVGARRFLACVGVLGVALAAITLFHDAVGLQRVFGVYLPEGRTAGRIGPLLNVNNFASYLNLALFCLLGLAVDSRHRLRRGAALAFALLLALGVLESRSLGATIALALGLAMTAVLVLREREHKARGLIALVALLLAGAGVALVALEGAVAAKLAKLELVAWSLPMLREHLLFGVGRGAFESAFPAYRAGALGLGGSNAVFAHAENFLVEWTVEWGLPVTLTAVLGFLFAFHPRFGRDAFRLPERVALVGVCGFFLQNLADLGTEVPGCMATVVAIVAVCLGAAEARRAGRRRREALGETPGSTSLMANWLAVSARARAFAAGSVFTAVVLAGAAGALRVPSVGSERVRLLARMQKTNFEDLDARRSFERELEAALYRFPAEPYLRLLGAQAARRSAGGNPLVWLNAALERETKNGETYLLLAAALAEQGARLQALDVLRYGIESVPDATLRAVHVAQRIGRTLEERLRAVPAGNAGVPALLALADLAAATDERLVLYRAAQARDARSLDGKAVPPDLASGLFGVADSGQAAETLLHECSKAAEPLPCYRNVVALAASERRGDVVERLGRELVAQACGRGAGCAEVELLVADQLSALGAWAEAMARYEHALSRDPGASAWPRLARAAYEARATGVALQALRRARREGQPVENWLADAIERSLETE